MILLDTSDYKQLPLNIKPLYLSFVEIKIDDMLKRHDLAFTQVLQYYSIQDIKEAFRSSFFERGRLTVDSMSKYDTILRLLEYGGLDIKPCHFITEVKALFNHTFRREATNV